MNILDKIRSMSPLKRHFTSAAIGAGAWGIAAFSGIGGMSMAVTLGGSFLVSAYSDPYSGRIGPFSTDSLKNIGMFIAGFILAPKMLGAAFSAAHAGPDLNDTNVLQSNAPITQSVDTKPALIDLNQPQITLDLKR